MEETYLSHGTYYLTEAEESESRNLLEGLSINERFEEEPKAYFEEKVMTAVFRYSELFFGNSRRDF